MIKLLLAVGLCLFPAFGKLHAQAVTKGNASYYSNKLHGRRMSNGQRYHKDSMTCAHLKYPLGTILKVRNPLNNKEVIVKVTDRGPHTKRFVIDLSRAAAQKLDIIQAGFSMVEITPYHPGIVPFRLKEQNELPELQLEYHPETPSPRLPWQKDSTFIQKTQVPRHIVKVKSIPRSPQPPATSQPRTAPIKKKAGQPSKKK